jgi:hypothetical protein
MQAIETIAPPDDPAPSSEIPELPRIPDDRPSWLFPLGCAGLMAITLPILALTRPPAPIPPEGPSALSTLSDFPSDEPITGDRDVGPAPAVEALLQPRHETPRASPRITPGALQVSGRLPKEVIGRIVRQQQGRFRFCYREGLRNNPNLAGTVAVRFVIGRDGAVSNVGNGGSTLPDGGVVACLVRAFYGLSFPQPEGGIVTVTYPIAMWPG